jgi:hypothetical protein
MAAWCHCCCCCCCLRVLVLTVLQSLQQLVCCYCCQVGLAPWGLLLLLVLVLLVLGRCTGQGPQLRERGRTPSCKQSSLQGTKDRHNMFNVGIMAHVHSFAPTACYVLAKQS